MQMNKSMVWLAGLMLLSTLGGVDAQVRINEVHYDPEPNTAALEFIELFNNGSNVVDIGGWYFSEGVEYTFPANTLIPAGGHLVVAQDPMSIDNKFGVSALGPWLGRLRNEGETIVLRNSLGVKVDSLDYQRGFPWPVCPDGRSMELIHPGLDNDLGGSWRSSGRVETIETVTHIATSALGWRYFKGVEEPSSSLGAWRNEAFDDSEWLTGQTSIGYGDDDDNTTLSDMQGFYTTVYLRKTFIVDASKIPSSLLLRVYVDDGAVVWINGDEVARLHVPDGELAYDSTGVNHTAEWEELSIPGSMLVAGTNVVAVQALNKAIGSSDFSINLELLSHLEEYSLLPSPGIENRAWTESAPPAIRHVEHSPEQPAAGEAVVVCAKVTCPEGVGSVSLEYQQVGPGDYVRASDTAYHMGWTALSMTDDGAGGDEVAEDDVYSAIIPAAVQRHRDLIRYRITMVGSNGVSQRVPYADDDRLNFSYFVYDGVPSWTGSDQPESPEKIFSTNVMANTLPVYHLIATEDDVVNCQYDKTYTDIRFYGTLVYDGRVYDHIQFKVRGEVNPYKCGKNKWRFYFNTGDNLEARDNYGKKYETPIRRLNFNACASPHVPVNRGMAGLDEAGSFRLHQLAGVVAPNTFYTQLRVIDDLDEAPADDQYAGDLWGLYMALEHIDGRFLAEHDLPDGNTYKIRSKGEKRNQSATQSEDDSDWATFRASIDGNTEADWRSSFDLDSYYSFRGLNYALSNVDLRPTVNYGMYHHPDGHWYVIPQDLDMMFVPVTHQVGEVAMRSCLNYPALEIESMNRSRELLDLLFDDAAVDGGQAVQVFHELAQWVNPPGESNTISDVDHFMWNHNPRTSVRKKHRGAFYLSPNYDSKLGGDWTRTLETSDFEGFVQYITDFITDTDPDGFVVGDGDQRGYGYNHLELKAADTNIPDRPTLTYTGPDGYPVDQLAFNSSGFSDSSGSFSAIEWRVGRIRNPSTPDHQPGERWIYEIQDLWESGELEEESYSIDLPVDLVAGNTYRVRVRHKDDTGRWSHWSLPIQFVALGVDVPRQLLLSEVHYNPEGPEGGSGYDEDDFEFIELFNSGDEPIDLRGYALDDGVEFSFRNSAVETLPAGEYVVLVRNLPAFASRYNTNGINIAGSYSGKLSNGGENIRLEYHGQKLFNISYNDSRGWPQAADCGGPSLVPKTERVAEQGFDIFDYPGYWRASTYVHGSPGMADPAPPPAIMINEIVAHTDTGNPAPLDSNDQIELFNPTDAAVVLDGHWYLSDDLSDTMQWNIPSGTIIPAGGWALFDEDDFHPGRTTGFGLNKAGEQVILSHHPDAGMDRVVDCVAFEGQANGASWGRYPDGDEFFQTLEPTPNAANQLPAPGIRIQQLMSNPLPVEGYNADEVLEYIMLTNGSSHAIALDGQPDTTNTWRMNGGVDYLFAPGTSMAAGECLWLVPFDPVAQPEQKALFCAVYGLDAGTVRLLGRYSGDLSNSGERITLERPQASDTPDPDDISWIVVDEVTWLDEAPWPSETDGAGLPLLRRGPAGNNPSGWTIPHDFDSDGLPDAWELSYRGSLLDLGPGDFDGDGQSDWAEFIAGTLAIDAESLLEFTYCQSDDDGIVMGWESVSGRVYSVSWSSNLTAQFLPIAENLAYPRGSYTDEVYRTGNAAFFRLGVWTNTVPAE